MADNDNRDIRLKDVNGNYLYPLAREDDQGRVFKETYLNKLGEDSYISSAEVKDVESSETGIKVKKLVLTNKQDPEHPIEFIGGDGGYATWGFITGDISDQGDLNLTIKSAVDITLTKKNKIFKQATIPESTSECSLIEGDLWYVTGFVEGYTIGKWYTYSIDESGIPYWDEVTDIQITENSAKITLTDEKLATEVTERKEGEAKAYSTIEQTAHSIKSEVGITRNRFYLPVDEPPMLSSELLVQNGDLWYCSDNSKGWGKDTWYICRNASTGIWEEATPSEIIDLKTTMEQTAEDIRIDAGIDYTKFYLPADEPPVDSSEQPVKEGDLWYCSDSSKGYKSGTWYICTNASTGLWREALPQEYESLRSAIVINAAGISTVAEQSAKNYSKITQRVDGVTTEVHHATNIYRQPTAPIEDSSHKLFAGDLWYDTNEETLEADRWHIWEIEVEIDPETGERKYNGSWAIIEPNSNILSYDTQISIIDNTSKIDQADDHINLIVEHKQSNYTGDEPPQDYTDAKGNTIKVLEGELWYCTKDNTEKGYKAEYWYVCTGNDSEGNTTWEPKNDGQINKIEVDTDGIRLVAESTSRVFRQSEMPTCREKATSEKAEVSLRKGDLWYCTNGITEATYSDARTKQCPVKNPNYDSTKTEPEYKEFMSYINNTCYEYSGTYDSTLEIPIWDYCEDPAIKNSKAWIETTGESIRSEVYDEDGRVSKVIQTAEGVQTEVEDARGGKASLSAKIGEIENSLSSKVENSELNTKVGQYIDSEAGTAKIVSAASGTYLSKNDASDTYETITNVAKLTQEVNSQGAKIGLVVTSDGGTNKVNTAEIVAAVNEEGSTALIKADKIQMTGTTTFVKTGDIYTKDKTTIDGGKITADTLSVEKLIVDGKSIGDETANTKLAYLGVDKIRSICNNSNPAADPKIVLMQNYLGECVNTPYDIQISTAGIKWKPYNTTSSAWVLVTWPEVLNSVAKFG